MHINAAATSVLHIDELFNSPTPFAKPVDT